MDYKERKGSPRLTSLAQAATLLQREATLHFVTFLTVAGIHDFFLLDLSVSEAAVSPFMPNRLFYLDIVDKSIKHLKGVWFSLLMNIFSFFEREVSIYHVSCKYCGP